MHKWYGGSINAAECGDSSWTPRTSVYSFGASLWKIATGVSWEALCCAKASFVAAAAVFIAGTVPLLTHNPVPAGFCCSCAQNEISSAALCLPPCILQQSLRSTALILRRHYAVATSLSWQNFCCIVHGPSSLPAVGSVLKARICMMSASLGLKARICMMSASLGLLHSTECED